MLRYAENLTVVETAAVLEIEPRDVRRIELAVMRQIQQRLRAAPK